MGKGGQTPGVHVDAGGAVKFDADCEKALQKVGLNPDDFGTYTEVKNRIQEAKDKRSKDAAEQYTAGSQSGHIQQNATLQEAGQRDNPCANRKGAEGYQTSEAPCMPHFGKSSGRGDTHYEITVAEMACAKGYGKPGTPLTARQMEKCARRTVEIAVRGANPDNREKSPKELQKEIKEQERLAKKGKTKAAREAAERKAGQAKSELAQRRSAAALTAKTGKKPRDPSKPKERKITEGEEDKAVKCIMSYWKKAMDQMRKKCAKEHSTESKLAKKLAPKKPTKKEIADAKKELKERLKKKPQSPDDCLENQANFLSDRGGRLPRLAGGVPGRVGGKSAGRGKKSGGTRAG